MQPWYEEEIGLRYRQMDCSVRVGDIVQKLLTTRSCTREEFKKIYKLLCKYTHPDLTGKDGGDFIRLQEIYTDLKKRETEVRLPMPGLLDPYKILKDSGYPKLKEPRAALYVSLYRYVQAGVNAYKIRSKDVLKNRNTLILRTVLYWAGAYDKDFIPIFIDYNSRVFDHIRVSSVLKQELKGKRLFLEGLDWFFKYQDTGRESSGSIAKDKLKAGKYTFKLFGYDYSPVIPFANWLMTELAKEPIRFQHSLK